MTPESERIWPKENRLPQQKVDEFFLQDEKTDMMYLLKESYCYCQLALESAEEELRQIKDLGREYLEENRKLREEIERLKGLVEKAWFDGYGIGIHRESTKLFYQQFKEENNI